MTITPDEPPGRIGGDHDESRRERRAVGSSDRYVLGPLLGRGGMADVYRAHDQTLGRDVAVKVLRDRAPDPTDRARFVAEAQTLARLNHPNLVTILDAGVSGEHPYLVLELVTGSSLAAALKQAGAPGLAPGRVLHIGAQIAAALAHCHAAGIVHRDVKPGNILVDADDRTLLTDFGISRLLDEGAHQTKTGFTIGTASYLAPEQVQGDELTPAVDLYALGLVLLEACTGRREYSGSPVEAAVARLHRAPSIPADLPTGLAEILRSLLHTDPSLRPTAGEAARALATGASPPLRGTPFPGPVRPHAEDRVTRLGPGPDPAAATGPLDVATAPHAAARFAETAPVGTAPGPARPLPRSTTSAQRRQSRTPFTLLGWAAAAAAAAIAVVLALHTAPATTSTTPTTEPTTARPSPSTRAHPVANLSPSATARSTKATHEPRSAATLSTPVKRARARADGSAQAAKTKPAKSKTKSTTKAQAKKPAPAGKGHGKAKHRGKGK